MKRRIPFIAVLLLAFIISCTPGDETFDPTPNTNSLSAKINGQLLSVSGVTVTANYTVIDAQIQTMSIGGARPANGNEAEGIALALVSGDSTGINAGETYTGISIEKRGTGTYFFRNSSQDVDAYSDILDISTITITAIDYTNKTISGTFSFDAIDNDDPNTTYEVREGEFKNVSFE